MKDSRCKYQQQENSEEQQVDATLQYICFATGKRNHAHSER